MQNQYRYIKMCVRVLDCRTNHLDDFIFEQTAMPDELIRKAQGTTGFEEELPWVYCYFALCHFILVL